MKNINKIETTAEDEAIMSYLSHTIAKALQNKYPEIFKEILDECIGQFDTEIIDGEEYLIIPREIFGGGE